MKILKTAATLMAVVALFFMAVPSARASEANQLTKIMINKPIQVPGNRVLGPGTYWLSVPQIGATHDQDLVLVYNKSRSHLVAMLPCTPAYRENLSGKTQVTLAEQPQYAPDALMRWFYPGMHYGHAFLYSSHTQKQLNEDATINAHANAMG